MSNEDLYHHILNNAEKDSKNPEYNNPIYENIQGPAGYRTLTQAELKYKMAAYPPTTPQGVPVRASIGVSPGGGNFRISFKDGKFLINVKPVTE